MGRAGVSLGAHEPIPGGVGGGGDTRLARPRRWRKEAGTSPSAQLNRGTFTERLLPASLPRGSSASSPSSSWPPASALPAASNAEGSPGLGARGAWLKAARGARERPASSR